jgi:hypothetical protein
MVVSVAALQLLVTRVAFSYKKSDDAHVSSCHRYSSINSITALCRLPRVGMGRVLQGKNEEAILS